MPEDRKRELLKTVRKMSERTHRAHAQMMDASADRAQAVREALDAGIPRSEIAEAAGVARTMIYRIAAEQMD